MTDNDHQFAVETERSLATLEQAISCLDRFGGDLRIFSYTMLRASSHLFAQVHGVQELAKAQTHIQSEEEKHRTTTGRA